jgi:hypothetical protein
MKVLRNHVVDGQGCANMAIVREQACPIPGGLTKQLSLMQRAGLLKVHNRAVTGLFTYTLHD